MCVVCVCKVCEVCVCVYVQSVCVCVQSVVFSMCSVCVWVCVVVGTVCGCAQQGTGLQVYFGSDNSLCVCTLCFALVTFLINQVHLPQADRSSPCVMRVKIDWNFRRPHFCMYSWARMLVMGHMRWTSAMSSFTAVVRD